MRPECLKSLLIIAIVALCGVAEEPVAAYTLTVTASHGSVTASPNKLQYDEGETVKLVPRPDVGYCFDRWSGDVKSTRLVYEITMDGNKIVRANFKTWEVPTGVPMPEFGIFDTYRMYDDPNNRSGDLTYYASPDGGYYTHYVDNTDPNSTDTSNTFGTVAKPRKTTPYDVPAGSVVEVHGGPYTFAWRWFSATGTFGYPVFYRGVGSEDRIVISNSQVRVGGSYMVIENFKLDNSGVTFHREYVPLIYDHIAIRNMEMTGRTSSSGSSVSTLSTASEINDVVIYANEIHHNGVVPEDSDSDVHGIYIVDNSNRVWIVDNDIHHNDGDSIQVNGCEGSCCTNNVWPQYVYIGRNTLHDDRENAVDCKDSEHIIISQNEVYGYTTEDRVFGADPNVRVVHGSDGTAILPGNEGGRSTWLLRNYIHDSQGAIRIDDECIVANSYIVGNVIYDVNGYGIITWRPMNIHMVSNTIYDVGIGFYSQDNDSSAGSQYTLSNNIFAKMNGYDTGDRGFLSCYVRIGVRSVAEATILRNNLFYDGGGFQWGRYYSYDSLASLIASEPNSCEDCLESDPLFVDANNCDFRTAAGSPAVGAAMLTNCEGLDSDIYEKFKQDYGISIACDVLGTERPQESSWDIGAYEYCVEAANDLAVSGVSQNSVTLSWTVPGEEGVTGTPAQYDIRRADSTITEANWGTATQVLGEPIPGNFGTQQSFTITGLDPNATYCFAMKILDEVGHASTLSNVLSGATTRSGNHAPVFTAIGDRSVLEMATLTFTISATDADGDTLTYSVSGLPTGATFTAATRTFTWTPTDTQEGVYHVMFQVTDGQVAVSETITITVLSGSNHPPDLETIGDKSVNEGGPLSFSVSATDVDPGQTVTYSVSGLPSGAAFVGQDFTWTPGFDQAGDYNVTFTASDGQAQDFETITITVVNVNRAPVLASVGNQQVNENFSLGFSISAADPDGDSMSYSASGLPSGASFVAGTFSWTPSFTQAGSYSVTFAATDGSLSDTEQITITVGNVSDETAPAVVDLYPEPDAIQIPINPLIVFAVSDAGLGVDANTVTIQVGGQLVYSGNQAESQSAYGICRRTGTKASYRYHYQPASEFDFDQRVSMSVTASDLANNVMDPCSYGFATEMRSFGGNEAISPSGLAGGHSAMATDSQGDLWAVCHAGQEGLRDVYVLKRDGSVLSWGDPVRLTDLASDQCNPVVAVAADDAVYVAWQDNRRGNWDIYVSSTADGVTWRDAVRVTDSNDNQTHPAIAIDSSDPPRVYIAWEDDSAGNQNIWLASSNTSFAGSTIAQVTSNAADETEPALAAGLGDVVYAVWTDRRNGSADIYGAASNASWANRPVVTGDGDQYRPAIAVESGTSSLHVVWVDDAAGNPDVLYGGSTGLPASAFAGVSLVDDTTDAGQLAPAIVAASDSLGRQYVYACWQDSRASGDAPDTDLYFVEIRSGVAGTNILVGDDGANSDQSEPALGFDGDGQPVILWTDDRDVTPYIYVAGGSCFGPALASASIPSASGGIVGPAPAAIDEITDISIRIPANAYDCDAVYTIWQVHNLPLFASACLAACEIGPSGVAFLSPATITMPHATSSTGLAVPYWYDAQTGTLSQEGISNVANTTSANGMPVVSFQTTHLTSFYILEGTVSSGSDGGGGGCSLAPGLSKKSEKTMPATSSKTMPSTSNKVKLRSQIGPARGLSPSGQSHGSPKVAGLICQPEVVEYFIPYAALAGIMVGLRIRDARRHRK